VRSYFVNYCQMHIELGTEVTADARAEKVFDAFCQRKERITSGVTHVVGAARSASNQFTILATAFRHRSAALVRHPAVVFVFGILVAVLFYENWFRANDRESMASIGTASSSSSPIGTSGIPIVPVAFLTSANGCDWGLSSPEIRSFGSSVQPGDEIALHEGIAEFRLASGVALSIEGPAAMVMTSPSSLVLQHGRVTVYVPWTVTDFKLTASACRFTACDAEFGINVAGGEVDLHTFSGKVFAAPAIEGRRENGFGIDLGETSEVIEREDNLPEGADFSKTNVGAGRGLKLQSKGSVTKVAKWHAAEKDEFATKLTMAGLLPVTDLYQEAVLSSKPISYWRFEDCKNNVVANEIPEACALMINGDLRLAGDSSNRVAEFGRPGSNCFLQSAGVIKLPKGSQYSVELWVKPSHVHEGSLVCMLADLSPKRKERAACYLQTAGFDHSRIARPRQSVRFLHRDPPGFQSSEGTSCYSQTRYSVRRWQYLVATKSDAEIRLYIDGILTDKQPETSSLAANLHLEIGQCGVARPVNPFIGQLDELAIYSRVLSEAEILKHFKAVEFKSSRSPSKQEI
jgi:hypothetical protein